MSQINIFLISSDDPLLKNERSSELVSMARAQLPYAHLMLFTHSDFQSTGNANLSALENELMDQGLFSFSDDSVDESVKKEFSTDRILKIYLKDLDRTAAQVLHLIAQRITKRTGIYVIVDLPRVAAKFAKLKPKDVQPKLKAGAGDTMVNQALSEIYSLGAKLELLYPPENDDLRRWVGNRASLYQLPMERDAVLFMANASEGNLTAIDQTMQILKLTVKGRAVSVDDINATMTQDSRFSGFELPEAIFNAQSERALNILSSVCSDHSSMTESLGFIIANLDQTLLAIADAKKENIARLKRNSAEYVKFFASHRIPNFRTQNAVLNASANMGQNFFDYITAELAKASRYYSTFRNNEAFHCLQNICTVVGNYRIMALHSL